jgi:hypothetical protein
MSLPINIKDLIYGHSVFTNIISKQVNKENGNLN